MSDPADNDDDELELEPVDPEIVAHQRRRAQEKTDEAIARVNFDEVYQRQDEGDPLIDVERLRQFRFSTKHLLMATAVLAIILTIGRLTESACSTIAILFTVVLAGGWAYVLRRERMLRAEKERLRAEFDAGRKVTSIPPAEVAEPVSSPLDGFRFAFSTKQMLLAMTVAAVVMGILTLAGNPSTVALLLGIIAIGGLVATALGIEAPPLVILGWWMLLVCYLIFGLWFAVFGDSAALPQRELPLFAIMAPQFPAIATQGASP